jgi:hypothetical protein
VHHQPIEAKTALAKTKILCNDKNIMIRSGKDTCTITQEEVIRNIHSLKNDEEPYYGPMTYNPNQRSLLYKTEIQEPINWQMVLEELMYRAFKEKFGNDFWKWEENRTIHIEYKHRPFYCDGENRFDNSRVIQKCLNQNRFELTLMTNKIQATLIVSNDELESVQNVQLSEDIKYHNQLHAEIWDKLDRWIIGEYPNFDQYINYDGSEFDTTQTQIAIWRKTLVKERKSFEETTKPIGDVFSSKELVDILISWGLLDSDGSVKQFEGKIILNFKVISNFHSHIYEFCINENGNLCCKRTDDEQSIFNKNQARIMNGNRADCTFEFYSGDVFVCHESTEDKPDIVYRISRDLMRLTHGVCLLNPSPSFLQSLRNGQITPFSHKILDQNVAENNRNRNAHLRDIRNTEKGLAKHLSNKELQELRDQGYAITPKS